MKSKNRYVAIDFEKLDTTPISVCSVGVAVIEDGKIVDTYYSLVKPPCKNENYYCFLAHGIKYNHVKNAPTFDKVWEIVDKMIGDSPLVAHNYGVERSCINACGEFFGTKTDYKYICTLSLSRKYMKELSSKSLDMVCESLGVKLKNHHNALEDAFATAESFIKMKEKYHIKDEDRK